MIKYLLFFLWPVAVYAGDYPASTFGIRSDGVTLNTRSIQYAVDYIHDRGGGRLVFEVGRYLTGSIHLKSDVGLELKEGVVLLGSLNPFDYDKNRFTALLLSDSQRNISISGGGMIDGRGREVAAGIVALVHSGIIGDPLVSDRPNEANRPMLIYFRSCSGVTVKDVTLANAASWVETYDQCSDLTIDNIRVDSKAYWNNDGMDIVDCSRVRVTGCLVDAADDGICLKSHDPAAACTDVLIRDCTIRSSANAIKFGTVSRGGFRHIRILHNRVYDTYRSALALEAVDGAAIEDVVADSLEAVNTGNALFMRIGARSGSRQSSLADVVIRHFSVQIAAGKADSGYPYEGPIEDQPRNISPIVLTGLPGACLQNIRLEDVTVRYPGGGNPFIAARDAADSVPELPAKYPEFSMFRELPAWGLYIRHARGVQVKNLHLFCAVKDYRKAIVLDDVEGANWEGTVVKGAGTVAKEARDKKVFGGLREAVLSPESPEPPDEPALIRISGKRIEFVYNGQSIFNGELTSSIDDVEIRQLKNVTGDVVTQVIKFVSRSGEPVSIRGAVMASGESFPCAVDRPEDEKGDIIRNSVGLSNSLLNRAIYDRWSDWVLSVDLFPTVKIIPQGGGSQNLFQLTVSGSLISFRFQPRYYQYHRGLTYYEPWTYTIWDGSIAGWCSWYAYMDDISEEKIKRTADVISEKLRPYGYNYFQIDDGYERQPSGFPATWLQPNNKFPSGLANLAEYIQSKGLIPGIWSNVSFQDRDSAYAHKDLFVQDEKGVPAFGQWIGYPLDGSNPAAIDQIIRPVFQGFKSMGWRYFKVDALRHLRYEGYNSFADYFTKKNLDRVTAYRNVMKMIREETGKENPILGCWGIRPELIGLIDACRIGNDGYSWAGLAQYNSFNNVVWRNDPDHIQLTTKNAYRDCMLTSMTGSLLMLTDKPRVYDTGNIEAAIRSAPVLSTRPGQLYDVDPSRSIHINRANTELSGSGPRIFDAGSSTPYDLFLLEINEPYENWMLLGRVGENRKHISFSELGLDPSRVYLVFEYWSKTFKGAFTGGFSPGPIDTVYNCQLFCIREAQNHPQIMATNRHLSCGALELTGVSWEKDTLSGRSAVIADEPYILYLYEPKGFTYGSFTCEGADFVGTKVAGSIRQIKLRSPGPLGKEGAPGAVNWKVSYR